MKKRARGERRKVCAHMTIVLLFSEILLPAPSPSPAGDDPSTKMWLLSISQADKYDAALAEGWKADMDGILIYVRSTYDWHVRPI